MGTDGKTVMSDGCAMMSPALARAIAKKLGLDDIPSAFQGRISGAKGLWTADPLYHRRPWKSGILDRGGSITTESTTSPQVSDRLQRIPTIRSNRVVNVTTASHYQYTVPISADEPVVFRSRCWKAVLKSISISTITQIYARRCLIPASYGPGIKNTIVRLEYLKWSTLVVVFLEIAVRKSI